MKKIEVCAVDEYIPITQRKYAPRVVETSYLVNLDGRGVYFQEEKSFEEVVGLVRGGKRLTNYPISMFAVTDNPDGTTTINRDFRSLNVGELESFDCGPEEIEERRNWGIPKN